MEGASTKHRPSMRVTRDPAGPAHLNLSSGSSTGPNQCPGVRTKWSEAQKIQSPLGNGSHLGRSELLVHGEAVKPGKWGKTRNIPEMRRKQARLKCSQLLRLLFRFYFAQHSFVPVL